MKKISLIFPILFLTFNSFGQIPTNLKYIRFLPIGISDHMINNPFTISTEPIDRKIVLERSLFGTQPSRLIGIDVDSLTENFAITDQETYKKILQYIRISTYLNIKFHEQKKTDDFGTFEIIRDTKIKYFLTSENSKAFFTELIYYLKKEKCDAKVIDGLNYQMKVNTPLN